jgi:hypothetical protein
MSPKRKLELTAFAASAVLTTAVLLLAMVAFRF